MPSQSRKYLTLQAGRGLAAVLVVVHHVSAYVGRDPRYWHLPRVLQFWTGGQLGVHYFFVLSGVVMLLAHRKDLGVPSRLRNYVIKRFRRIYPIYWIVLAFVVLPYLFRPSLGSSYQRDPWVVLSGVLLVHVHSMQVNLPVAWTLFHEVLFYAFFALLLLRQRIGWTVLTLWFSADLLSLWVSSPAFFQNYLTSPLNLLFGLGIGVAVLLDTDRIKYPLITALTGGGLFVFAFGWAAVFSSKSIWIQMLAGIASALIILGAGALENMERLRVSPRLLFLGDASYSIYLVHYPFFMVLAPILFRVWTHHPFPIWIVMLLMTILAVIVGCLLHVFVEKPLLRRKRARLPALSAA